MKITITTYTDDNKELLSRNYIVERYDTAKMSLNLDMLVEDSEVMEKEWVDEVNSKWCEAPEVSEDEHDCGAGNVDADGTCLVCGKTELI